MYLVSRPSVGQVFHDGSGFKTMEFAQLAVAAKPDREFTRNAGEEPKSRFVDSKSDSDPPNDDELASLKSAGKGFVLVEFPEIPSADEK